MDIRSVLDLLKQKGYKHTGKRETLASIFAGEQRYMAAKEVLSHMRNDYPQVSFDTVYRNLSLFEDLGILEATEFNGERLFRLQCTEEKHHHHLICTVCGKSKTIEMCPMDAFYGIPDGFEITGHKFEIYGLCEGCLV